MIKELYISKSFCCVGRNQKKCYGCAYCRVSNETEFEYSDLPITINKHFDQLPISVNLFYGDPLLQLDKTIEILRKLEDTPHTGPIVVITKGKLLDAYKKGFPDDFNLDLHLAFSTFGIEHEYDKISHKNLDSNLHTAHIKYPSYKKSVEFRPICYGINDSPDIIEGVFKISNNYNVVIGYSGLQGTPDTQKRWLKDGIELTPYPGFNFGHKKSISSEIQLLFDEMSVKYNVPIFRKTSCLISYVHGMQRDYNAHYYRPSEMNCENCVMKSKCFDFKKNKLSDEYYKESIKTVIPFNFDIIYKEKHECILKKKNICEFPTADCSNINGNIIKIDKKLTTADVRVIKWLTGYTVDADFEESTELSNEWNEIRKDI